MVQLTLIKHLFFVFNLVSTDLYISVTKSIDIDASTDAAEVGNAAVVANYVFERRSTAKDRNGMISDSDVPVCSRTRLSQAPCKIDVVAEGDLVLRKHFGFVAKVVRKTGCLLPSRVTTLDGW